MIKTFLLGIIFLISHQSAYSMNSEKWLQQDEAARQSQILSSIRNELSGLLEEIQKIIKNKKNLSSKEVTTQLHGFSKKTKDFIKNAFYSCSQSIEVSPEVSFYRRYEKLHPSSVLPYLGNTLKLYAEIDIFFYKLNEKTSNIPEFASHQDELKEQQAYCYTTTAIKFLDFINTFYQHILKIYEAKKTKSENHESGIKDLNEPLMGFLLGLIDTVLPYLDKCHPICRQDFIHLSVLSCNLFQFSILDERIKENKDLNWYYDFASKIKNITPLLFIHLKGVSHPNFFKKLIELIERDDHKLLSFYLDCAQKSIDWEHNQKSLGLLLWRQYCKKRKYSSVGDSLLSYGLLKSLLQEPKKTWDTNEKYLLFNHLIAFKTFEPNLSFLDSKAKEQFSKCTQTLQRLLESIPFSEEDWDEIHSKLPKTGNYPFLLDLIESIQGELDDFFLKYESFQKMLKTLVQDNATEDFQRHLSLIQTHKPFQKFIPFGRELFSIALKKQSFLPLLLEAGVQPHAPDLAECTRHFLLKAKSENSNPLSPELKSLLLEAAAKNQQTKLIHALVKENAKWSAAYLQDPKWRASLIKCLQSNEASHFVQLQDYLNACDDRLDPHLKQEIVNELLGEAFKHSCFDAIQWLLEQGAQPSEALKLDIRAMSSEQLRLYCQLGFGKQILDCAIKEQLWDAITILLDEGVDINSLLKEPIPLEDPTGMLSFCKMVQLQLDDAEASSQLKQCLSHNWIIAYAHHGSKVFQDNPGLLAKWLPADADLLNELEWKSQAAYFASVNFQWNCAHCLDSIQFNQLTCWLDQCRCTHNEKKPYHQECLTEWFTKNAVNPEPRLRGECPVCRTAGTLIPTKSAAIVSQKKNLDL